MLEMQVQTQAEVKESLELDLLAAVERITKAEDRMARLEAAAEERMGRLEVALAEATAAAAAASSGANGVATAATSCSSASRGFAGTQLLDHEWSELKACFPSKTNIDAKTGAGAERLLVYFRAAQWTRYISTGDRWSAFLADVRVYMQKRAANELLLISTLHPRVVPLRKGKKRNAEAIQDDVPSAQGQALAIQDCQVLSIQDGNADGGDSLFISMRVDTLGLAGDGGYEQCCWETAMPAENTLGSLQRAFLHHHGIMDGVAKLVYKTAELSDDLPLDRSLADCGFTDPELLYIVAAVPEEHTFCVDSDGNIVESNECFNVQDGYLLDSPAVNGSDLLGYQLDGTHAPRQSARGITQLGNTCYGNALLQSLSAIEAFRFWVGDHKRLCSGHRCVLCMVAEDMMALGGTLKSTLCCHKCKSKTGKIDLVSCFSVDVPSSGPQTLEAALRSYCSRQALHADKDEPCIDCGAVGDRTKQLSVLSWPKVLAIHVRRWLEGERPGHFTKDSRHLSFDIAYHGFPGAYKLASIVQHVGRAFGSGHYHAFARTDRDEWLMFNDGAVRQSSAREVMSREAYMLFYERQDLA